MLQVGSAKGVARLLQRAGLPGHLALLRSAHGKRSGKVWAALAALCGALPTLLAITGVLGLAAVVLVHEVAEIFDSFKDPAARAAGLPAARVAKARKSGASILS